MKTISWSNDLQTTIRSSRKSPLESANSQSLTAKEKKAMKQVIRKTSNPEEKEALELWV